MDSIGSFSALLSEKPKQRKPHKPRETKVILPRLSNVEWPPVLALFIEWN
jgi:hypothetical protein